MSYDKRTFDLLMKRLAERKHKFEYTREVNGQKFVDTALAFCDGAEAAHNLFQKELESYKKQIELLTKALEGYQGYHNYVTKELIDVLYKNKTTPGIERADAAERQQAVLQEELSIFIDDLKKVPVNEKA